MAKKKSNMVKKKLDRVSLRIFRRQIKNYLIQVIDVIQVGFKSFFESSITKLLNQKNYGLLYMYYKSKVFAQFCNTTHMLW